MHDSVVFANALIRFFDFYPNIMTNLYFLGGNVGTLNFFEIKVLNHFLDKFGDLRSGRKLELIKSDKRVILKVILNINEGNYPSIKRTNRIIKVKLKIKEPINSHDGEIRKVILKINESENIYPVTNLRLLECHNQSSMNEGLHNDVIEINTRPQRNAAKRALQRIKNVSN